MKVLITLVIIFLDSLQGFSQQYDTALIPYRKGILWGYCTPDKKIVIEPRFQEANLFQGLLAIVKIDAQYGVINRQGKLLLTAKFGIPVITNDGKNYISFEPNGIIFDDNGKSLTTSYAFIEPYNKYGYAGVTDRTSLNKGILDSNFHEVVVPKYAEIEFLSSGLVKGLDGQSHKWGLINLKTGNQFPCDYTAIFEEHEGLMMASKDSLFGFINADGQEIIPFKYINVTNANWPHGYEMNEKNCVGYNINGFYEGLAVVEYGNKAGYINKEGELMIPFGFETAFGFSGNRAWVKKNGKWGMINKKGQFVLEPVYSSPEYMLHNEQLELEGFHDGLVLVTKHNKYGYADTNGKLVVPCNYTNGQSFCNGLAAVQKKGKIFFIDRTGKQTTPPVSQIAALGAQANRMRLVCIAENAEYPPEQSWQITDTSGVVKSVKIADIAGKTGFTGDIASVYAMADSTLFYVFNRNSEAIFQSPFRVQIYTPELIYSNDCSCYINLKRHVKYCD